MPDFDFIFSETPSVQFATNLFVNVPTILQYENIPLIEVVQAETVGRTTQFSIYHSDGTYLAKLKGARLFPTPEGHRAGLVLQHLPDMTVCKMNGHEIIELSRIGPAAIATQAELYTPNGAFVKSRNSVLNDEGVPIEPPIAFSVTGGSLSVPGGLVTFCTFNGARIAVLVKADGSVKIPVA